VTQVFTDDLHLQTLEEFLSATTKLHPAVNVRQIIVSLIDRLASYAAREAENEDPEEKKQKEDEAATRLAEKVKSMRVTQNGDSPAGNGDDTETGPASTDSLSKKSETQDSQEDGEIRGIPKDINLFDVFWTQMNELVKVRSSSLCTLLLTKVTRLDQIYRSRILPHSWSVYASWHSTAIPTP